MKVVIAQLPIDQSPRRNVDRAADILQHHQSWGPDLVILPPAFISGPLQRPDHNSDWPAAVREAWADFLALSRNYPRPLLITSSLNLEDGPYHSRETGFIIKNGETLLAQPRITGSLKPPEVQPTIMAAGRRLALTLGPDRLLPRPPDGAEVVIELAAEFYQGPSNRSQAPGPGHRPGAWVCRVNTCGGQGSRVFTGGSFILNPEGFTAARAPEFEAAEIRLDLTEPTRFKPEPAPEPLETLRLALVTGLRDYVARAGFNHVILGLSGGLDSSLCAVLAVQALGPKRVRGLALPSPYNSPESALDAARLARNLGLDFGEISISGLLERTLKELNPHLAPDASGDATALMAENIQARLRGMLLMALSNQNRGLLICTTNKSETAMGYGTLYGDLCGSLAPLGDIYKSRAYELARHINLNGPLIPESILTKAPSAELKPGQTDQDFLPPYPLLDDILYRLVELRQSAAEASAASPYRNEPGFSETVAFIRRQMSRSAFKILQIPPGLIAGPRPFKPE